MAELSKIRKNDVDYDLKDTAAREAAGKAVRTVNGVAPDAGGNVALTGYATQQWVQEGYQPLGSYLESAELSAAIRTALAQAKESGEFDGDPGAAGPQGPKGDDYILTAADKEEIAELAADLVDVPDSGGESNILVVTVSNSIASHSPAEIKEASDAGKLVVMRNDGVFVHLGTALTDKATFVHSEIAIAGSSGIAGNIAYTVNADKSVTDNTEWMQLSSPPETETWTFTLEDGSTVTKAVHVG